MFVHACAPAKINLTLDIRGKRDDGYHLVHTVMQAVTIYETARVTKTEHAGTELTVAGADIPPKQCTTVFRAVDSFFHQTGIGRFGVAVHLDKRVPVGAGLAGASADAAAVLAALNQLAQAGLSVERLCDIGASVGADVPFCLMGGAAVGTGTGATLSALPSLPDCAILIAKPAKSISTEKAYALFDEQGCLSECSEQRMINALFSGDVLSVARSLHNDFQAVINLTEVEEIKQIMMRHGTIGGQMSGSGSAVFGIFLGDDFAKACFDELITKYCDVFLCRPDSRGARIIK